ncbi:hypothetical protein BJ878DRAFT_172750 [Calycina marina]|uniref:Uncharacterized protein n=1 Tax=Calycina marina TaxID=1763456 RepID=A0A9P8CJH4_9HELO|nr:hypothetical protein BJ878DRAFT_172750 [Calycina marina]
MSKMSVPTSPRYGKPIQDYSMGSSARQNGQGNDGENLQRKALPFIPMSALGRMCNAPLSPVRTSVQDGDWFPNPSSGTIEDVGQPLLPTNANVQKSNVKHGSPISPGKAIPYRPNDNSGTFPDHQAGMIFSGNSIGSTTPLKESGKVQTTRISEPGGDENVHEVEPQPVPQLQYFHHQSHHSEGGMRSKQNDIYSSPQQKNLFETGASINRHLTPTTQMARRTPVQQRPYSAYSDMGPRNGSPGSTQNSPKFRGGSIGSSLSFDRPLSYMDTDLANVMYPQAPPPAISTDNSQLRELVGRNASLLAMNKTLAMYRSNVKKTTSIEAQYSFAILLIQHAQEMGVPEDDGTSIPRKSPKSDRHDDQSPYVQPMESTPKDLIHEAKHILQNLSDKGYPFAQYYLADGYSSGLFSKGKPDHNTGFPLFVSASKHGHAESSYRAALCYEFGWGCRKDVIKAAQFYKQAASKNHPGASTRLGRALLSGDLGTTSYREGLKWLNRATESADLQYNAAPFLLGELYEHGDGKDIFKDDVYAARLFTQAADLGHADAGFRLGDAYEHGKLSCPRDPALSIHFYTGSANLGNAAAMMALCAWYMVGAEPILEKNENEAYEWARQAADLGLTKGEYAVGYFTEMGIGCRRDPLEANVWYVKAAEAGDERAVHRLEAIRAAASGGKHMEVSLPGSGAKKTKRKNGDAKAVGSTEAGEKNCIVM